MTILIMAKVPRAGLVKTRLCPPCTPEQAASLAYAALMDTVDAALATGVPVAVALEGGDLPELPPQIHRFPQIGANFSERLAHAWAQISTPAVQIAMDTPQVTAAELLHALDAARDGAALGLASDGGWWIIGFGEPPPEGMFDIPMSQSDTGLQQQKKLEEYGLHIELLATARDVDTWDDAESVAALAPNGRFAAVLATISPSAEPIST